MAGGNERRLGFGELWMDDQRSYSPNSTRDQRESRRSSRSGKYLIDADVVCRRDRLGRGVGIGIVGKVRGRVIDDGAEPVRWLGHADIDGQVDQALGDVAIAVVLKIMNRSEPSPRVIMNRIRESLRKLWVSSPMEVQITRV